MLVVVSIGLALWVFLFASLARIQLFEHVAYRDLADRQHTRHVEIPCDRGQILDRHDNVLAGTLSSPSVIADPARIEDVRAVSRKLGSILGIRASEIRSRLGRGGRFVWLDRRITPERGDAVVAAAIPGICLVPEKDRVRPYGDLALPVLGITDVDNRGIEGIEREFDEVLRGTEGWKLLQQIPTRASRSLPDVPHRPPVDGRDLVLTLDASVQSVVELELNRAVEDKDAAWGMALAMEPATGEIVAIACATPDGGNDRCPVPSMNRCVAAQFEPGSTYKIVTFAAALEEGVVSPDDVFPAGNGKMNFGSYTIHDPKDHYDTLTVREAFEYSSNVVTAQIALALGEENLYSYSRAFGFGSRSGVELPGEVAGILRRPKNWSGRSLPTIAIGHELTVNLIQMAAAYGAIANGGVLMEPRIVREVRDADGSVVERFPPRRVRRVVSTETAELLREFLAGVVERGTGKAANLGFVRAAGKSGTAQMVEESGGFSHSRFTSSFIGFVPAEDPKLVVAVVLVDISDVYYGGIVVGPVFREIVLKSACSEMGDPFHDLLRRKAAAAYVEPDAARPSAIVPAVAMGERPSKMPDLRGLLLRDAKACLLRADASVRLVGAGTVKSQQPSPGTSLEPGIRCALVGSEP